MVRERRKGWERKSSEQQKGQTMQCMDQRGVKTIAIYEKLQEQKKNTDIIHVS